MAVSVASIIFLTLALVLVLDALVALVFRRWVRRTMKWLLQKPERLLTLAVSELIAGIVFGIGAYLL
ncbi:hypothetical protein HYZ97_01160 [Candidatus Pacearchaeota archaeon]|nr:hypothetical protein [Candidatus Pacearchaeota archaeon]